jgi:hypothetical protein
MGLFGGKDWNIIAVIFERRDLYRINGNRGKGGDAVKMRDGAKGHSRTLYWAVFDQKRAFLEGDLGGGAKLITSDILQRLKRDLPTNSTVQQILGMLEQGKLPMVAKPMIWAGYPKPDAIPPAEA